MCVCAFDLCVFFFFLVLFLVCSYIPVRMCVSVVLHVCVVFNLLLRIVGTVTCLCRDC